MTKKKILFVCLGNICRSPLAEGIMRKVQKEHQLQFDLDSAGTSNYHIGEAPDSRTQKNALRNGVDLSELRARQFRAKDLEDFDHIFVMDKKNYQTIIETFGDSKNLDKISLLPNPDNEEHFVEIPDPYFGEEDGFEAVFQLLQKSINRLCLKLSETN